LIPNFFVFATNKFLLQQDSNTHSTNKINCLKVAETPDTTAFIDVSDKPKFFYGYASFYSKNLEGSKTSSDETFRHNKLTCASNRFKLGTWLRVINLSNDKSIIVRVNDRMHKRMDKKGRIVDLSYIGAKKLGFISKGITKVKVEAVPKGTKE
jgi:rare lipoprotein A (peptidoglycan hydrolase)